MSNVNWKYFEITKKESFEFIESALDSRNASIDAANDFCKKVGAVDVFQYNTGAIAAISFYGSKTEIDMKVWKKVKDGHMPRAKTELAKEMQNLPKIINANDVCRDYGFGGEMVLGGKGVRGFKMHSSYIKGVRKSNKWFICVPYNDDFNKAVDGSLIERKEWEVLKSMDEWSDK